MIPNWQYTDEYEKDRREILKIVDRVFSSGRLILGKELESFEKGFAAFCGLEFGVGVNSGTDALFLALRSLGIQQGDEVVTVSFTAVPTVAAVRAAGATPVFVDVEEDTCLMEVAKIESALTQKTRCLLPVHLFGQPADMGPLLDIAKSRGLSVVEDCAQAAGALYMGSRVGSFGDAGAFSFYPTKVLGGYGDAGMAVTAREDLYQKLRRLRFYGMEGSYYAEEEGYNSRLDEVQAAILNFKLARIEESAEKRRRLAEQYSAALEGVGDIALPSVRGGRSHQYYTYTIRTRHRDGLKAYLCEQGIEARVNYQTPVHLMRGYGFLGYGPGDLPVTERLSAEVLSLPMFPGLSSEEAGKVTDAVRTFFRRALRRE